MNQPFAQHPSSGTVHLVGAGPGDPDLLTLKALKALKAADVVVYDRLVSPEIMMLIPPHVRCLDVGKLPKCHKVSQDQINQILIHEARLGHCVVRLKGGDPLIFGRGSEEAADLRAAGIAVSYVPGITSAQGASSATGVPLTHRSLATGVRYITGHRAKDAQLDLDWANLAAEDTTLVIYMGAMNMLEITAQLRAHGMPATLPVMAIASATTPREMRIISTLGTLPRDLEATNLTSPVLFVVGHVVSLYPEIATNFAYSQETIAHA